MSDNVQEIKSRLDVVELLKGYIQVTPAGKNFKALCPFHKEKSPSFMISPERGSWHCFGCGEGGDIFAFVMKYENVEFYDALKLLAEKAGVELERQSGAANHAYKRLFDINRAAKDFFTGVLNSPAPTAHRDAAKKYLIERGLSEQTVKEFEIGLAPMASDGLFRALSAAKVPTQEIEQAGLAIRTERGTYWDRFRGRIMFPLYNNVGKVIGFTGRVLPSGSGITAEAAKYVNSPETPIFSKSRVLYGFHKAKNFIREAKTAIVVEGQMDFLMMWQDGIKNVIASSGTALTTEHLQALRRLAETLILSFDSDSAGIAAAERSIDLAQRLDFAVKLLEIKGHKDPAEVVQAAPGKMAEFVAAAKPAMVYYFDRYLGAAENPLQRKKNLRTVLQKIAYMQSAIDRTHWLRELSVRSGVPEAALAEELGGLKAGPPEAKVPAPSAGESSATAPRERSRQDVISERLLSLCAADVSLKAEAAAYEPYMSAPYGELFAHLTSAGFGAVSGELGAVADLVALRSGFFAGMVNVKDELAKLGKELYKEHMKGTLAGLREKIARLEKEGDDAQLVAAVKDLHAVKKEFDALNK